MAASYNLGLSVFYGIVEQSVANENDQPVLVHAGNVVLETVRMFFYETNDIIVSIDRRFETTHAIGRDKELVPMNALAIAVKTHL